jgi:HrpA-like RNA helicase
LTQNQLRKLCEREFLSFMRVREWRDVHRQLVLACRELGFRDNQQPADYEALHRALLAGLLSHIAVLDEQREYLGARSRKLRIFPGSSVFKKAPKWIHAGVCARCGAHRSAVGARHQRRFAETQLQRAALAREKRPRDGAGNDRFIWTYAQR